MLNNLDGMAQDLNRPLYAQDPYQQQGYNQPPPYQQGYQQPPNQQQLPSYQQMRPGAEGGYQQQPPGGYQPPPGGYQQPPGGYQQQAPGQWTMGGARYWQGPEQDAFEILNQIEAVQIVEKVKGMEILTGFETGNRYKIKDHKTGCDLFLAVECQDGMMGAIGRNALSGSNRPFNLKVGLLRGDGIPPQRFAFLQRPFKCTCFCLQRPETHILDVRSGPQGPHRTLGHIKEPFACCQFNLEVSNPEGQKYGEVKECCTTMCCFGCPCKQEVDFPIKGDKGQQIGNIKKRATAATLVSMATDIVVDADNFVVEFIPNITPEEKFNAIATALFMDFAYFTKSGAEGGESGAQALGQAVGGDEGGEIGALAGFAFGAIAAAQQANRPQEIPW